tara:strand:+ start:43 stop:402 length:360 start_codon:yes stop_codon:yes gene_type:complete
MSNPRKLSNIRLTGISEKGLDNFVKENKGFIFYETWAGIKQAVRRNRLTAEICTVNSPNDIVTIDRDEWENALSSSLGYFESRDEFEQCREIKFTINLLQYGKKQLRTPQTISGSVITS